MSDYDNTRYYWLQLREEFFESDEIDWLEEQPNGPAQVLFYLKLCLKSLKTNGLLAAGWVRCSSRMTQKSSPTSLDPTSTLSSAQS